MEESSNADEFLVLYFDDQPNLKTWVRCYYPPQRVSLLCFEALSLSA